MSRFLALVLALAALAPALGAQTAELRRVVLEDGTVLVGFVEDESADPLVLVTESGVEQRIPLAQVAEVGPLINGRFFRVDPTRTRTVLAPTGRTLGRGRTRVGTLVYVVPNATVGVTDRLDVGGTLLLSGGSDSFALFPTAGAKLNLVDTGSLAVAVGANVGLAVGDGGGGVLATPYAAVTLGDELRAVSASVSGFAGGDLEGGGFDVANGAVLTVAGETQVNNGVKLLLDVVVPVTEGDSGVGFLPGVRLFGDRYSVDVFGVVGVADGGFAGFAPLANFAFSF